MACGATLLDEPTSRVLTLRRYQGADQEAVWQLHKVALESTNAYVEASPWDDDLKKIEEVYLTRRGAFLVGLCEQKLVAMGAPKEVAEETAEIKRMRVYPEYQGRGYGKEVLTQLEAQAKTLGYKKLVLDTSKAQVAAQHLYRSFGYGEKKRELWRVEIIFFEKPL